MLANRPNDNTHADWGNRSSPYIPSDPGFHLAFIAPNREAVDRFHAAALKYGGISECAP